MVDTSAFTEFVRGHTEIVHEIRTASPLYVSAIDLGELRAGFAAGGRLQVPYSTASFC